MRRRRLWTVGVCLVLWPAAAVPGAAFRHAPPSAWDVRAGAVRVVCPLTIGGSFEAKTSAISGSFVPGAPPAASGEFVVDLDTLDTGIGLRNAHMRDRYLETGRAPEFAKAVLSDIQLAGLDTAAPSGRGSFTGLLRLHGVQRPVEGQVEVRRRGTSLQVQVVFPVRLPDFDIPKPRYLGVGVRDEVTVHVTFEPVPR